MPWHRVQYDGQWGYVRYDMLRFMTQAEIEAYLNNLNATPAPTLVTTPQPYDPTNYSSYGYVTTTTSVNFRQQPSMNASRIRKLYNYAFCFVLGTTTGTDGETWYHIRYNDQEGYVNGKYFHWMTVEELEEFLQSIEYKQGIQNNTTGNATAKPTSGLIPEEDKTINDWKGSGVTVSYKPFPGFSTPGPLTSPTTAPTQETATPTPSASPTPTLEPLPTAAATYPVVNESGNSGLVIFIVIAVVLLLGGVIVALADAEMAGILQRYFADFSFMFLAAVVLLVFIVNENLQPGSTVQNLLMKVLLVLVAVSVLYSALLCFVPETGWYSDVYPWAYRDIIETAQFWT